MQLNALLDVNCEVLLFPKSNNSIYGLIDKFATKKDKKKQIERESSVFFNNVVFLNAQISVLDRNTP